ncbi:MAG: DNA primase [Acidobacteriota bacterium]|nr:DNA primase [Blastocatellia bacterium]MDW8239126.1 DNA primase [Acidobacteriota bacterium]
MRIPRGFADEVRQQLDIVRVASEYVTLRRRGANYIALCPFHHEKTPSFTVHPGKQIFKCFGCGRGGDVFGLVMALEHCGFSDAVRLLAEKNGIAIPHVPERPELIEAEQREQQWRDTLYQLNRWAQDFFREQWKTAEARPAIEYLISRGLQDSTVEQMALGYAPQRWDALSLFLRRRGVSEEHLARSGLVIPRENSPGYYDRFRGRLMFPITDAQGRIVAFGGRALADEQQAGPKYVNSPETSVYTKGRHLYGLYQAREAIRQAGWVILVEGYFDFLMPFQAGIRNIVASLGTALTDAQVSLLKRYVSKVVVSFDADPAGRAAVMRSLQRLVHHGFEVYVVTLPPGHDPDTFIRQFGAEAYRQALRQALPYIDFVLMHVTASADLNQPAARAQALRAVLPYLASIPDRIERAASADHVASRLTLDSKLVHEELRRERHHQRETAPAPGLAVSAESGPTLLQTITSAERLLLEILLNRPDIVEQLREQLLTNRMIFEGTAAQRLFERIIECIGHSEPLDYATLATGLQDQPELLDLLERCLIVEVSREREVVYEEARGCLASLQARCLEQELRRLQQEIDLAEQQCNRELSLQLSMRKREISNLLVKNVAQAHKKG